MARAHPDHSLGERSNIVPLRGRQDGGCARPASSRPKPQPVIGVLLSVPRRSRGAVQAAFRRGLAEAGCRDGDAVTVAFQSGECTAGHYRELAADLLARSGDVVLVGGGNLAARAASEASRTVPMVLLASPIERLGAVASHGRPGGNATGIDLLSDQLAERRLSLLFEMAPNTARLHVLVDRSEPARPRGLLERARALGLDAELHPVSTERDIELALSDAARHPNSALLVAIGSPCCGREELIAARSARHALPACFETRGPLAAGGLLSYGARLSAAYRQAGWLVARIVKGERPDTLPVQQATEFELAVNWRAARRLGLAVPPRLLATADEVIL